MEFLERSLEIKELQAALEAAASGTGSVVLIGAEAHRRILSRLPATPGPSARGWLRD